MYRSCVALLLFTMSLAATEWELAKITPGSGEWLTTSHSYAGSLRTTDAPSTRQQRRGRSTSKTMEHAPGQPRGALTPP